VFRALPVGAWGAGVILSSQGPEVAPDLPTSTAGARGLHCSAPPEPPCGGQGSEGYRQKWPQNAQGRIFGGKDFRISTVTGPIGPVLALRLGDREGHAVACPHLDLPYWPNQLGSSIAPVRRQRGAGDSGIL
jgi:hypothetical protein